MRMKRNVHRHDQTTGIDTISVRFHSPHDSRLQHRRGPKRCVREKTLSKLIHQRDSTKIRPLRHGLVETVRVGFY